VPLLFDTLRGTLRGAVRENEPMSAHTTWRVGGPADLFIVPADREDLGTALDLLNQANCPWMVVGRGSNLLVKDGGIRGAVLCLGSLDRVTFLPEAKVVAEAGIPLMRLIRLCAEKGLGGLEAMAGIPGTLGGAVAMNAGAGGQELSDVVEAITLTGLAGEQTLPAAELDFAYRRCRLPERSLVVDAALQLRPDDPEALGAVIAERITHRRQAHRVGGPNAGSVFKNPPGGQAWRLIDAVGMRGAVSGGARVSEQHANFIVNAGGAKAKDILDLIARIRDAVRKDSGIDLEPEVRIVGCDQPR